ncbi:MAG: hypothetical protein HYY92_03840 [Parcubacteria group bacterium]|nr:hypothetical protein [Parcubacteria group bacterium]
MKLRGIDFGPVWGASGVTGFFGEGYPFHRILRPFGLNFKGMTFAAKTTVFLPQKGFLLLKKNGVTPQELLPSCITIRFFKGAVLNAVALSGPGAEALFKDGRWQTRTEPFFLSFATVGASAEERLAELRGFVMLCKWYVPSFRAPVGLQLNFSCPNTGIHELFVEEILEHLSVAAALGVPLVPKISVLVPPPTAKKIAAHPSCDALCVSNTVPWGALPDEIDWEGLFGSEVSPLARFGGGGLSGSPIFPIVTDWMFAASLLKIPKPICAGGGILKESDIDLLAALKAQAVSLGSVAILRGWRVKRLIEYAHARLT